MVPNHGETIMVKSEQKQHERIHVGEYKGTIIFNYNSVSSGNCQEHVHVILDANGSIVPFSEWKRRMDHKWMEVDGENQMFPNRKAAVDGASNFCRRRRDRMDFQTTSINDEKKHVLVQWRDRETLDPKRAKFFWSCLRIDL